MFTSCYSAACMVTQRTNAYGSLGDTADHVRRPNYLSPNTARQSEASLHMVSVTPQLFLHKQIVWNIKLGM